ncbi:MAG: hypothetical protein U1E51_35710, partial [Candidatus Binatia bacterium]|nr:hypothetical protein [Candidatus Binatia bacterium]
MAMIRRLSQGLQNGFPVAPIVLTIREFERRQKNGDPLLGKISKQGFLYERRRGSLEGGKSRVVADAKGIVWRK